MDFELAPAVVAGLAATTIIATISVVLRSTRLSGLDVLLLHGSLFTSEPRRARVVGASMHVMIGGVFGALYVGLFALAGAGVSEVWWWGLMLGAAHGFVAGIFMDAVETFHPQLEPAYGEIVDTVRGERAESSTVTSRAPTRVAHKMTAPGPFGVRYGSLTPAEVVLGHVAFGVLVGLLYAAIV